jgi:hypothetical protein
LRLPGVILFREGGWIVRLAWQAFIDVGRNG